MLRVFLKALLALVAAKADGLATMEAYSENSNMWSRIRVLIIEMAKIKANLQADLKKKHQIMQYFFLKNPIMACNLK